MTEIPNHRPLTTVHNVLHPTTSRVRYTNTRTYTRQGWLENQTRGGYSTSEPRQNSPLYVRVRTLRCTLHTASRCSAEQQEYIVEYSGKIVLRQNETDSTTRNSFFFSVAEIKKTNNWSRVSARTPRCPSSRAFKLSCGFGSRPTRSRGDFTYTPRVMERAPN